MNLTQTYQNLAYVFWGIGIALFIVAIMLFFRLRIVKAIQGLMKLDKTIPTGNYSRPKTLDETTTLLQSDVTKALSEETQLLADSSFDIIFELMEIHTNQLIS